MQIKIKYNNCSMAKKSKKNKKPENKPENFWPDLTRKIGYGLFVALLVYITFVISRKIGLNLGICPFILPGCK